jgi:tripartite-type tricarboxylate transporter receptor subunit TctC
VPIGTYVDMCSKLPLVDPARITMPAIALPHLKSGWLRALAVSAVKRSPEIPEVPTLAEAGVPGYEATIWMGLFAPAGTPPEILGKLYGEIGRVLSAPEARASIGATGVEVALSPAEEFGAFVPAEHDKWGKVVRDTGATVNQRTLKPR